MPLLGGGKPSLQEISAAEWSPCRTYRYRLQRAYAPGPRIAWLLLNPSTADEYANDPTVERCCRRSLRYGYGTVEIVNLFALRSTDPRALFAHPDPVGPGNNAAIVAAVREAELVVCGWGNHAEVAGRAREVAGLLAPYAAKLHALKLTQKGHPWHPLYVGYACMPRPFQLRA